MKTKRHLGYAKALKVAEWLRSNRAVVEKHGHDLGEIQRLIEHDLNIEAAPTTIIRLCGTCGISLPTPSHRRSRLAEVAVLLANSIQHLYEALGEPPHPALLKARELCRTSTSNSVEPQLIEARHD